MPILAHLHDWVAIIGGYKCQVAGCTAIMTDNLLAQFAPNDNDAAMADMGDDQSIFNAAWQQIPSNNQQ